MLTKHSESFDSVATKIGRTGFISRGFIWASVGIIAVVAAFTGDETKGTQGALEVIASRKGGIVFLILITLGIFCYSSWRFFEGVYGLRIKPNGSKFQKIVGGIITPFASGTAYCIFAASNINVIVHGISSSNGSSDILATISHHVIGEVFITLIAVLLFVTAIMWIVDLIKMKPLEDLDLKRLYKHTPIKILVLTFCYLGTFGRAILFGLLGALFFRLCYASDISGGGFGVALQQLQYNTTARIFLVFFGFLIFQFGIFSCFQAVYKIFLPYHPHLRTSHRAATEHRSQGIFANGKSSRVVRYEEALDAEDREHKGKEAMEQMYGKDYDKKKDEKKDEKDEKKTEMPIAKPTA